MELPLDRVSSIIFDGHDEEFEVAEDSIFEMGDHGEVSYLLTLKIRGEVNSFWQTFYFLHYNLDFCDANDGESFIFVRVQPVVKVSIGWEE
jgi:hypothetical protein